MIWRTRSFVILATIILIKTLCTYPNTTYFPLFFPLLPCTYPITPHSGVCTYIRISTFFGVSRWFCISNCEILKVKINMTISKDALHKETTLKEFLSFLKRIELWSNNFAPRILLLSKFENLWHALIYKEIEFFLLP